jgi:hypothetical protein
MENSMKKKLIFQVEVLKSDVNTLMKAGISNTSMVTDILCQIRKQREKQYSLKEKETAKQKEQLSLWG